MLTVLKLNHSDKSSNLWDSSKISQIESDLVSLGYNFEDLIRQLKRIVGYRNESTEKKTKLFFREVSKLYELCVDLVGHREKVDKIIAEKTCSNGSKDEIMYFIKTTLLKVKRLRIRDEDIICDGGKFWLRHTICTPVFLGVKTKILIVPVFREIIDDDRKHLNFIEKNIRFMEQAGEHVNSEIFVVFSEDVEVFRENVRRACGKGYRTVVISVRTLLEVNQSKNREDMFEDIFVDG